MIRLTWLEERGDEEVEIPVWLGSVAAYYQGPDGKSYVVTSMGRLPVKEDLDTVAGLVAGLDEAHLRGHLGEMEKQILQQVNTALIATQQNFNDALQRQTDFIYEQIEKNYNQIAEHVQGLEKMK